MSHVFAVGGRYRLPESRRSYRDSATTLTTIALTLVAALLGVVGCAAEPEPTPPNVVLISLDTLRADHVGAHGYSHDTTPNLDELAERGVVFENAYVHAPNTAPSHTSIFTSLYPTVHDVWSQGQTPSPQIPVLAELFRDAGYETAAFVQLPAEATYGRGFDTYHILRTDRRGKRLDNLDPILEWLGAEPRDRPFFLFLHSYAVHLPYGPPEEYARRFSPDYDGRLSRVIRRDDVDRFNSGEWELTEEDFAHIVAMYDAELAYADHQLGLVFDRLEEVAPPDDTVIAVLSDHGEEFGDHGKVGRHTYSLYEELLRVPLILAGPSVRAGRKVSERVRAIDVAPTLLELAGIEPPGFYLGSDLAPLLSGGDEPPRIVLAERAKGRQRALVWSVYKYHSGAELYNLNADPGEARDLAPEHPEAAAELKERLDLLVEELVTLRDQLGQAGEVVLTPEEVEQLRALGYIR